MPRPRVALAVFQRNLSVLKFNFNIKNPNSPAEKWDFSGLFHINPLLRINLFQFKFFKKQHWLEDWK